MAAVYMSAFVYGPLYVEYTYYQKMFFRCFTLTMDVIESSTNVPFPFPAASTVYVAGPSRSGKSYLLSKILHNRQDMFSEKVDRVLYCYGVWGEYLQHIEKNGVNLNHGLPSEEEIADFADSSSHTLLILDDLISEIARNAWVQDLFTRLSHHKNMSIMWVSQNIYNQGKHMRTIALNCTHIILFKNPRDCQQIATLGRQLGNSKLLQCAYSDATAKPHGYILIDLTQACPSKFMFRGNILPGENTIVYA